MIKIFTGDDRIRAQKEITKLLGPDHEIIEGADLTPEDLPSITKGASLFADTRNILIRDLSTNKSVYEAFPNYLDTPHNIIIQEIKLDKRTSTYNVIKDKVEIKEFKLAEDPNKKLVFDIYHTAKRNGEKAIKMLEKIEQDQDPMMFTGLMISQALKDYKNHPSAKEKKALKELSKLDINLKSTSFQPWLLVKSFLLQVSSL